MHFQNILIIDDDPDDAGLMTYAIAKIDPCIKCFFASNGKEAIKYLDTGHVAPGLILLDINMPIMNGVEFLTIRQSHPLLSNIPVVVHTTASDDNTADTIRKLGANEFVVKPYSFNEMVSQLTSILLMFGLTGSPAR